MKKLILGLSILAIAGASTFVACKKDEVKKETKTEKAKSTNQRQAGSGITIFHVELHRYKGTSKQTHSSCNCYQCFGMCDLVVLGHSFFTVGDNVIMEDIGNDQSKLYFLTQPDADVSIDPTLYIDDDVTINEGSDFTVIKADAYPYNGTAGTFNYQNSNYSYYGTAIVNTLP